jgi:hypothetical protein
MPTIGARAARPPAKNRPTTSGQAEPKPDRRRVRTRAALIAAAQRILADDARAEVSIKQITDAADVGFGSFYNHFDTKAEPRPYEIEQREPVPFPVGQLRTRSPAWAESSVADGPLAKFT